MPDPCNRKEEMAKQGGKREEKRCGQFNCPDLLRWALWSSGFFRCNKCEQSGWRRKRGGSGFC